jgi:hypothetical protein
MKLMKHMKETKMTSSWPSCFSWWTIPVIVMGITLSATQTTRQQSVQSAWGVVSPSVLALWMSHQDEKGLAVLDVLALWRGEPGWCLHGPRNFGGSGSFTATSARAQIAGLDLTATLRPEARAVDVLGQTVSLTDGRNVLLIDHIDGPAAGVTIDTRSIDPHLESSGPITPVLRRTPELKAFLRCGTPLADASLQPVADRLCALIDGRQQP